MKKCVSALLCLSFFAVAAANAQGIGDGDVVVVEPSSPAFGTVGRTAVSLSAPAFVPLNSAIAWTLDSQLNLSFNSVINSAFVAAVPLPSGAIVERLEVNGCDDSATGELRFQLYAPLDSGNAETSGFISSGIAATGGCAVYGGDTFTDLVVASGSRSYAAIVFATGGSATTIRTFRVFYRLQVSPTPAVATFADVPTSHGFFRFVEALAAAGITGGCGGGNYCPNAPVTRGQMAVFLATALGLHWPD